MFSYILCYIYIYKTVLKTTHTCVYLYVHTHTYKTFNTVVSERKLNILIFIYSNALWWLNVIFKKVLIIQRDNRISVYKYFL